MDRRLLGADVQEYNRYSAMVRRQGGHPYLFFCDCVDGNSPVGVSVFYGARPLMIACGKCGRAVAVTVIRPKRGALHLHVVDLKIE